MCLILFAVDPSADQKLVVAANRDEQHSRATAKADFWNDQPHVLGGRDLQAGGTWLGVSKKGRFAAVTNFAETPPDPIPPNSRGELTADFLSGHEDCESYLTSVHKKAHLYRGFNLLVSDGQDVYYYSNRGSQILKLEPGFYGLSNQLLDCDWPKVNRGRDRLRHLLKSSEWDQTSSDLFNMLACTGDGSPHSASFILGETYGTSVSTVVSMGPAGATFEERSFNNQGDETGRTAVNLPGVSNQLA